MPLNPVVTRVTYDVAKTGLDVAELHVSYAADAESAARENADRHRQRLTRAEAIRGPASLCSAADGTLSCQVPSPYLGNYDLVVYCDQTTCQMPVLAVHSTIVVSASWSTEFNTPETAGAAISDKVEAIHSFLAPLTSGL